MLAIEVLASELTGGELRTFNKLSIISSMIIYIFHSSRVLHFANNYQSVRYSDEFNDFVGDIRGETRLPFASEGQFAVWYASSLNTLNRGRRVASI